VSGLFGTIQDVTVKKPRRACALVNNCCAPFTKTCRSPWAWWKKRARPSDLFRQPGHRPTARLHSTSLANRVLAETSPAHLCSGIWTHWFREGSELQELFKIEHHHDEAKRDYAITLVPLGGGAEENGANSFVSSSTTSPNAKA